MKKQERIDRIELMRTFIRIVEAGSLSAAAAQMNTTQATVSRRLQSLEALLGAKLILRTTHAMKLTDDGETLLSARPTGRRCLAGTRGRPADYR